MFGDITIRQKYVREERFGLSIDTPANYTHLSCITESLAWTFYFVLLVRAMDQTVTPFT